MEKKKGNLIIRDYKEDRKKRRRELDYRAEAAAVWRTGAERRCGGGEREAEAEREKGEESGCDPHPEMLCWLREDEMSVQELLQRVQCVITHVGESAVLPPLRPACVRSLVAVVKMRGARKGGGGR